MSPHGLVFGQWLVLDALHKEGLSSMTALAAMIGVDRTTLTRTIDGLVAAGHVDRKTPAEDRRLVVVDLTPAGHQAAERIASDLAPIHASVFAGLSRDDLDSLSTLLGRALVQIKLAAAEGPRPQAIARIERRSQARRQVQGATLRPRPRP